MKLRAVILDWAGTLADFGSRAPIAALECVFAAAGVPVSTDEARQSMGLAKKDHIRAILGTPRVHHAWTLRYGVEPSEDAVNQLYAKFIPSQTRVLENHSQLIPGVAEAAVRMRSRGLKIGTTTGYTRPMLDYLLERAAEQDFIPDSALCPDDVPAGRPWPWMCYLSAIRLQAYPMSAFVKIGDTPADVEEGRNAGMWTIGVTRTGNEVGCSLEEWEQLSDSHQQELLNRAQERLRGAHYIAPSAAECGSIFDDIEGRLARGETP